MKAVFIVFNQAHTEPVKYVIDQLRITGYTWWNDVTGRGTETGDPRMGTHTWPEMNSALMTIVESDRVEALLEKVKRIDEINKEVGIRAFVWDITQSY